MSVPRSPLVPALLLLGLALPGVACGGSASADEAPRVAASSDVEAGRYLVEISGCNDCHTAGFEQAGGEMPEERWLTGNPVGYRGPWGTTYASNLRLLVSQMTETEWIDAYSSRELRPPMPWWGLHEMSPEDLRAMYTFIESLGPAGEPTPEFVPPGREPKTPFVVMVPEEPAK